MCSPSIVIVVDGRDIVWSEQWCGEQRHLLRAVRSAGACLLTTLCIFLTHLCGQPSVLMH
jgi:hypothetical protein